MVEEASGGSRFAISTGMSDLSFPAFDDAPAQPAAASDARTASDATCPTCEAPTFQPSRIRWFERWRTVATLRRPFRCAACGHRAWIEPAALSYQTDFPAAAPTADIDLTALDIEWKDTNLGEPGSWDLRI
jgi:hypothetical protein